MNVYILRHGETDWNKKGILQGSTDIPLNALGIEMAEKTRNGLLRDKIFFDMIISSPYLRARETAEIIAGPGNITVVSNYLLREMCFGKYEGHKISDFQKYSEYRGISKAFYDPVHYQNEGEAESYEDLFIRISDFLTNNLLPLESTCENVLLVCHSAVIRAFICLINNMPLDAYWSISLVNCGINIAKVENGHIKMTDKKLIYYDNKVDNTKRFFV